MRGWLDDARRAVTDVAKARAVLARMLPVPATWGKRSAATLTPEPQAPIDFRPLELAKEIDAYAIRYAALARGALRAGVSPRGRTADRLRFIVGALGRVDAEDPALAREIVRDARRLLSRFSKIVTPGEGSYIMSAPCPVDRCQAKRLWVDRGTWRVMCGVCGTSWGPAELEKLASASVAGTRDPV